MMLLVAMAITRGVRGQRADLARRRWLRPRLLVGAGPPRRDHAARPLAGDAGHRPGSRALSTRSPRCCPTRPTGYVPTGRSRRSPRRARPRATSCSCAPVPGSRPTAIVIDGEAEVDESMITGESRPVPKAAGRPGRGRHGGDRLGDAGAGRRRRRRHRTGRHPAARRAGPGVPVPGAGAGRPGRGAAVLRRQRRRADHLRHLAGARRRRPTPSSAPSPCWSSPARTPWAWPSRW